MKLKHFFRVLALAVLELCVGMASAAHVKPNIIVILNDDQGYQDLGCYGSPDIKTPQIDKLAAEGMRFTDFYVGAPVCSASRAALLTGCYPNRVGVYGVFFPNRGHHGLDPKYVTIAEVLKTVGYATMAVGKWHLGDEAEFLPTHQGFDAYYGIPYSNDMTPAQSMTYAEDCLFREGVTKQAIDEAFARDTSGKGAPKAFKRKVPLMRDDECIEFPADQSTLTQRYANEGIKFISKSVKASKPFFLYLANTMPHVPLYASPDFKGKSARGLYGDVIEEIDYNVGRILAHLKTLGIEENTLVVLTSDNGPWLTQGENGGCALPLFEGKFTHFEGGQRVPAIIRWPGHVPAGVVCQDIVASIDLLPTFARIAGAALPTVIPIDGKDMTDLITAKEGAKPLHDYFFLGTLAVRSGDWKYHTREIFKVKATQRDTRGPTLYNLKNDIGESRNVIDQYPEIAERLRHVLEKNPNQKPGNVKKRKS